jgi:hypothetical protein
MAGTKRNGGDNKMLITIRQSKCSGKEIAKVINVDRIIAIKIFEDAVEIAYNYSMNKSDPCPSVYYIDPEQWKTLRAIMVSRSVLINV